MEQKSPVKIILMNNNYLGNVRQWQAMFFNRRYSFTPMMNPDYMQIASAYGIASRRVMSREEPERRHSGNVIDRRSFPVGGLCGRRRKRVADDSSGKFGQLYVNGMLRGEGGEL